MIRQHARLAAVALTGAALAGGTGCVSLAEYQALQERFEKQQSYVERNRHEVGKAQHAAEVARLDRKKRERDMLILEQRYKAVEDALAIKRRELEEARIDASALAAAVNGAPETGTTETTAFVLDSSVLYPPGNAVLTPRGAAEVDKVAVRLLSPDMAGYQVRIEGHTDDTPIRKSSYKDNWDLSAARARAVLVRLTEKGVPAQRLCFAGYGPHRPIDPGRTEKARAKNRRVEIVLVQQPGTRAFTFEPAAPSNLSIGAEIEPAPPILSAPTVTGTAPLAPPADVSAPSDASSPR